MTEESNTAPPAPEAVEVVRTEAGLKPAFSKEDIEPVIPVDGEQQEQAEAPPPDHAPPNDGTHEVSFDDADADIDARDAENDQYVDDVAEESEDEESDSDPYGASEAEPSEEELRYTELEVLTEKIAAAKTQLAQIEEEKKAAEASAHATKADIDSAIAEADLRLQEVQQKINGLQADFDKKVDAQSSIDKTEDDAENAAEIA